MNRHMKIIHATYNYIECVISKWYHYIYSSCGKASGYCDCPEDAREWLFDQDPLLYETLVYVFANNQDDAKGDLHICMTEPNNEDCDL